MLQLRPLCENCGKELSPESNDALICSFECTFCKSCVENVLHNVCPNCGGGLEKRPVRPNDMLLKYPPANLKIYNPVKQEQFQPLLIRYKGIPPDKR